MPKVSAELRKSIREKLKSLITHQTMTVDDASQQAYALIYARSQGIPIFTHKLANGKGIVITRLKVVPLHRCPQCGYQRGAVVQ